MTVTLGATPEDVDAVGDTLEAQVGIVDQIKADVKKQLDGAAWVGGKKEAFEAQWIETFVPALDKMNTAFTGAGADCHTIAENTRLALS